MALTKINWEEFDTFDKIESPSPYDFRKHKARFYTFGEFGVAAVGKTADGISHVKDKGNVMSISVLT